MPYKEKPIEKVVWTIGEVADMFGITSHGVRFLCDELGLYPKKTKKMTPVGLMRSLSKKQVQTLSKARRLNDLGVPLDTLKRYGLNNADAMIEFFERIEEIKQKIF